MTYLPYVPQTASEIVDLLGGIMLGPPTMADPDFPLRTLDTEFGALNEGLAIIRPQLGEKRHAQLIELSHRIRAHFEADPTDTNGEAHRGYLLINEMQALLKGERQSDR